MYPCAWLVRMFEPQQAGLVFTGQHGTREDQEELDSSDPSGVFKARVSWRVSVCAIATVWAGYRYGRISVQLREHRCARFSSQGHACLGFLLLHPICGVVHAMLTAILMCSTRCYARWEDSYDVAGAC